MMELFPRPRVVIEAVGPDEADRLADIHADAFTRSWSPEEFEALASDARVLALGLRRHSVFWPPRLIGFVLIRVAADEAEVLSIAIRSANRGRGHGRRLMDEALRHLYRERVETCFLEVAHDNQVALSLYQSLGFETVGERKGYYHRNDGSAGAALVMRLKLR